MMNFSTPKKLNAAVAIAAMNTVVRVGYASSDYGRCAMIQLKIPGIPVSGNHRHGLTPQGQVYLTERAREYSRRIQSIAKAEVAISGWVMPDYVRVDLELTNISMDRDNVAKTVNDALQGIVYVDDRRILDGAISRYKDDGPAHVTVWVESINGVAYGFPKPRPPTLRVRQAAKRSLPAHVRAAMTRAEGGTA